MLRAAILLFSLRRTLRRRFYYPGTGQHLRSPRSTRVSGVPRSCPTGMLRKVKSKDTRWPDLTATGPPPAAGWQTTAYQDTPAGVGRPTPGRYGQRR